GRHAMVERTESKGSGASSFSLSSWRSVTLSVLGGTSALFGALRVRVGDEDSLRRFGDKIARSYKVVALLTLNALVLFAGFELVAGTTLKLRSFPNRDQQLVGDGRPRETISYYSSKDWAQTYWHEHRLSGKQRFYPYVGWRRAPFKGKTIVIDENGLRSTPGADCRAGSFKVFTFGESSMWGPGSPDWGTIPANVQKGLEKIRQGPVCVMNFAEAGYVSTQDVIMLSLQLRSGNIPDLVLFYSISGDIVAANQSG